VQLPQRVTKVLKQSAHPHPPSTHNFHFDPFANERISPAEWRHYSCQSDVKRKPFMAKGEGIPLSNENI
jgi:hypothetical protein